jgi:anti-anti-sigma regulatory factor
MTDGINIYLHQKQQGLLQQHYSTWDNCTMFQLPSRVYVYTMGAVIGLYRNIIASGRDAVEIDASAMRFIDPLGLCLLAAIVNKLDEAGIQINITNINPDIFDYLRRMDFLKQCQMDKGLGQNFVRHNRADRLVEVHRVLDQRDIDKSAARLTQAVIGSITDVRLDETPDEMSGKSEVDRLEHPLRYIFNELIENALTHGRGRGFGNASAWVAAQYYPQSGKMRLAVVDDGCGFLESLTGHRELPEPTHAAAIATALKAKVSRNRDVGLGRDSVNQGVGLTVTREIAMRAGGCLALASGDAWLADFTGNSRESKTIPHWQGVAAYLEFKREQLQQVDLVPIMQSLPGYAPVKGLKFE